MRCTNMKSTNTGKWMLLLGCFTALPLPVNANQDEHFNRVIERAQKLAEQTYQAPEESLPPALQDVNYDTYRQIRFAPEKAYWRDESPFNLQLFHSGFIFQTPITLNIIENDTVTPLPFSSDDFQYDDDAQALLEQDLTGSGHAGFRLHYPLNNQDYADEFAVFLGASYFRLTGQGQTYGLSTRGLAIDTASPEGEEFPAFREFWLYKPGANDDEITLLALLDSPSLSGAYRITLHPGEQTDAEIDARLFARSDVAKLGIAPLTSMYAFGEASYKRPDDFRPQVHDSDGLLIHTGADEWIWRPLSNPNNVHVSSFLDDAPNGFGLMQRQRNFERYLDMEAQYHLRPSQWVAPIEPWGAGHVELVEIPTPDETFDNIVAYWVADEPLKAGESRKLHYHTYTLNDVPEKHTLGQVIRTRHGTANVPGTGEDNALKRQFIVDFQGGPLNDIAADQPVGLEISTQTGEASAAHVMPLPDNAWRASFRIESHNEPSDIRLRLMLNGQPISETWNYVWYPDA